jgi:D-proline reductase (dithiol) PrdB
VARVLEEHGIVTVNLSINLELSRRVRAPRTVFVRYPHGAPFGVPGDRLGHLTVLRDLFWAAQDLREPGRILDPGYRWRRTTWEPVTPESFLRGDGAAGERAR